MAGNFQWVRKVLRIHGTFYISIPVQWVNANGLFPGSKLVIEASEDGLSIWPEGGL